MPRWGWIALAVVGLGALIFVGRRRVSAFIDTAGATVDPVTGARQAAASGIDYQAFLAGLGIDARSVDSAGNEIPLTRDFAIEACATRLATRPVTYNARMERVYGEAPYTRSEAIQECTRRLGRFVG